MIKIEIHPSLQHLTAGGEENGKKLMEVLNRHLEPWSKHLEQMTGQGADGFERMTVRNFLYAALTGKFKFVGADEPTAKEDDSSPRLPDP